MIVEGVRPGGERVGCAWVSFQIDSRTARAELTCGLSSSVEERMPRAAASAAAAAALKEMARGAG